MKKLVLIIMACSCVMTCLSGGCGEQPVTNQTGGSKGTEIPLSIAGTWQQRGNGLWRMVIEPNGTVSSAVTALYVIIRPNQITREKMIDGTVSTYLGGDCHAEYNPANRELFAIIETKELHISMYGHMLDGNEVDTFIGPVSEDGKVWTPQWIMLYNYGVDFPQDVNNIEPNPEPIFLDKVEDWRPPADKGPGPKK